MASASAFKIPAIFQAIDKLSKPMRFMEKNATRFGSKLQGSFERANRSVNRFMPGMGEAGRQMISFAKSAAIAGGIIAGVSLTFDGITEYEEKAQSLQAITGVNAAQFKSFESEIFKVANAQKVLGSEVANTFEVIASDIPTLLGNEAALGKVAKAAIILKKASGDDLATSTTALTATLNQFNLTADDSLRVIDAMAAGNVAGNVSVSQQAEGVVKFGAVLNDMNGSIEDAVALQQVLGKANLKGAESGTKLLNVLAFMDTANVLPPKAQEDLKKYGVNIDIVIDHTKTMSERIKEMSKIAGDTGAIKNVFGLQNVTAAKTLMNNVVLFNKIRGDVTGANASNKAMGLAIVKTDTLGVKIDELKSRWINIITGSEKSGAAIKLLGAGISFLTDNLETIILVLGVYVGALIAVKVATVLVRGAVLAYNIVLGISNALQGKSVFALKKSGVAMVAHATVVNGLSFATKAWALVTQGATIVMRALSAAMLMNPIGLVIVAVVALGFAIKAMIDHWDTWGKYVALISGPIGILVFAVKSLYDRWDEVKQAFASDGIIGAIKMIGVILKESFIDTITKGKAVLVGFFSGMKTGIIDNILMPLKSVLALADKFGLDGGLFEVLERREAEKGTSSNASPVNLKATQSEVEGARFESIKEGRLGITIDDKTKSAKVDDSDLAGIPIETLSTGGF